MKSERVERNAISINLENKNEGFFKRFTANLYHVLTNKALLGNTIIKIGMYVLLLGIAFIFIFPFLFMAVTSIKTNADLLDPTVGWIPKTVKIKNYIMAAQAMQYNKFFFNSLFLTLVATFGHIVSATFIGYGLARYRFRGRNLLFLMVILAIIVPTPTIIIALYMTYSNFGWIGTYLPILVPCFFGFGLKGGLYVFISRQFLLSLPKEMEEAARIDGCNFLAIFLRIVVPIARPLILVMTVLSLVWTWNDYYEPIIFLNSPSMQPLPSALTAIINYANMPIEEIMKLYPYINEEDLFNKATVMAGCAITILPLLFMFSFVQEKFVQGIERTGLVE